MKPATRIADIVVKPGLSPAGECVLVGVVLNDGRTAWGHCEPLPAATDTVRIVQQQITPILRDQPVASVPALISQIDDLRESVPITRIVQPLPASSASGATLSRRRLLTGFLTEDTAKTEVAHESRPVHPAIRFGLSQALMQALALSQNKPVVAILQEIYDLPATRTAVPLLVDANEANLALVKPVMLTAVAAVGYNTGHTNHKQTLGPNAERLQAHVRRVQAWLSATAPDAQPAIHLNIQGGFTELYDLDAGKLLGALYGLEQAARPYALTIENLVAGEVTAVTQTLQTLQSYLKTRQMRVKLAAGDSLFSAADLETVIQASAVHQVHFDPAWFGSIPQILQFVQACHQQGNAVILHGRNASAATAVALAIAAGVQVLSGPPDQLFNEMQKALAAG